MSFIRKIKKGNKTYLAEVESKRIKGKVVQKHIRYIGKEVNGKKVISLSSEDIQISEVKIHGPLIVLDKISKKIKLPDILENYSNEILSMVYAHCLNYKSVNNMPDWFSRTDLNTILDLEGLTEERLLSALDSLTEERIERHQRDIFNIVKNIYDLSTKGIVYDVTNTYLYGTKCQLAKLGKSKDGKSKPLIQIGLARTQKEGIPVFHKTFNGNIHDSKALFSLIKSFSSYNLRSGVFVSDRGVTSRQNIEGIKGLGWNSLCGLPLKDREKKVLRKALKTKPISHVSNMARLGKNTFYIKSFPYKLGKIKGKLAICFNERRKVEIKESRHHEIEHAQNQILQGKPIKTGLEKYLTSQGRIRKQELEKAEEFDGYFCLFSTKNIPDRDMLKLYFDKDIIEKAFKTLKGITHLRPIRHWLYNRVIAHVFICYLSYLLLSVLKLSLNNLKISPEEALKELGSVYKVYMEDKKKRHMFSKIVTLSKSQEKILKAVDKHLVK